MRIHSWDPGKSTGWAILDDGVLQAQGTVVGEEALMRYLIELERELFPADIWVIEDYKIRMDPTVKGYNHAWSQVFPAQVIGMLKLKAYEFEIPTILQQPSIKAMANQMVFGEKYKKSGAKDAHSKDAVLHGLFYYRTVVQRAQENKF